MRNIIFTDTRDRDKVELDRVQYGTIVTEVTGHPQSVYLKVKKSELGAGVRLPWPKNHSLLVNLRSGTMRAVGCSEKVRVLREELHLQHVENIELNSEFLKY